MPVSLPHSLRVLMPDGTVRRMLLEDYLRGVVAAALPGDAPLESLKAQAVAARTFAANTHRHLERGADVCTQRHCQAWNERANPAASRAVIDTRGVVATYNGKLIDAFYFDHCDGKTRDGTGILLNAPAYLKSVPCPCGFATMKGHGVGMCLRGMLAMARFGDPYDVILKHYYTGITLEAVGVDAATTQEPLTPRARPASAPTKQGAKPARRTTRPKTTAQTETAPSVETPTAPTGERAAAPPPIEPKAEVELPPTLAMPPAAAPLEPVSPPVPEPPVTVAPIAPEPLLTSDKPEAAEADDLLYYLAVEDAAPIPAPPSTIYYPPPVEAVPPPTMPEMWEGAGETTSPSFAPPPTMPEDLPSALELDFIVPPTIESIAEESSEVEPLVAMNDVPVVERYFAPLDAPPSMPEALPSFSNVLGAFDSEPRPDETPIVWAVPPPLRESTEEPSLPKVLSTPKVLIDYLPGPRIIAGNLPKSGMIVTVRDRQGNSVVTVSGVAKQYGSGGFEAPLTDDGAYLVKFDGTELDVTVDQETVFIYYG